MKDETMNAMKPCPFCGGQAKYYDDLYGGGWVKGVACGSCEAAVITPCYSSAARTKQELIDNWNRRAGCESHSLRKL